MRHGNYNRHIQRADSHLYHPAHAIRNDIARHARNENPAERLIENNGGVDSAIRASIDGRDGPLLLKQVRQVFGSVRGMTRFTLSKAPIPLEQLLPSALCCWRHCGESYSVAMRASARCTRTDAGSEPTRSECTNCPPLIPTTGNSR